MSQGPATELAQFFHETYERLAPEFGYQTKEASAVPWSQVPDANKRLMIATCSRVLAHLGLDVPFPGLGRSLSWAQRRQRIGGRQMSDEPICGNLISVRPTEANGFNDVTLCRLRPGHAGDHLPDMSRYHREVVPAQYSWVANKR